MAQIKSWKTNEVLFEYKDDNPTMKETVEEAVRQGISLEFADLSGADLIYADLYRANLKYADLSGANLINALLRGADLEGANLKNADLRNAHLAFADLRGANLINAILRGADLKHTNINGANFEGANLFNADLYKAIGIPEDLIPLACPIDGSFIAWKKVDNKLVKLEIPEDAKRSSATTHKCRCSKAKVLAITSLYETESFNEAITYNYAPLTYKVGEMVYPDSFDEYRWAECSNGIHFFMDKEEAINWRF